MNTIQKSLEDLKQKQIQEMDKKLKEIELSEKLGDLPGVDLRFINTSPLYKYICAYGTLTGSLEELWKYIQRNGVEIDDVKGRAYTFWPGIPDDSPDPERPNAFRQNAFEHASTGKNGLIVMNYGSIGRRWTLQFFIKDPDQYRIEIEIPADKLPQGLHRLIPMCQVGTQGYAKSWHSANSGLPSHFRVSEDKQSVNVDYLLDKGGIKEYLKLV